MSRQMRDEEFMSTVYKGLLGGIETKANLVYQRLCTVILDGHLKPGDRLNVDEIARELGVSKIPIREALQRLETQGLIVQTPHAGARIAPVSHRELIGVYLIRIELEALAARLAAATITEADIEALRAINKRMRALCDAEDIGVLRSLNQEFHVIIAQATGYATLVETINTMFLKAAIYRVVMPPRKETWSQVIAEHMAMIAALADHDPLRASQAARAHVKQQVPNEVRDQASQLFPPEQ